MDRPNPTLPQLTAADTDSNASGLQRQFALFAALFLVVWGVLLTPIANNPWLAVPGYMTAFGAAMFVTNILLAALLFNRGVAERSAATVKLGSAYFFVAIIFVPLMAVFPGAFVPGSIIGETVSAVWIWNFWHAGFAILILRYALEVHRALPGRKTKPVRECVVLVLVVVVLAGIATVGLPGLPALFANGKTFFEGPMRLIAWAILGLNVAALCAVLKIPDKTSEQVWLAVGMIAACLDVWLTFHGSDRFSLGWYLSKMGSLLTSMVVLMSLFVDLTSLYRRVSQANAMLAQLASRDGLTGLANRRSFDEKLDSEWRRAVRLQQPLALLMLDVDHFKLYNDSFGHLGGDDCLRRVSATIASHAARPGDLAARYGGEEFAVILPNTDAAGAINLATRIREGVAALGLIHPQSSLKRVTISVGVAVIVPAQDQRPAALVALADQALYQAKHLGRDRVHLAEEPAQPAKAPLVGVPSPVAVGMSA